MPSFKTPLRYPGGKQRIWSFVDEVITENGIDGGDYAEPFAGGAGVAMELLLRERVARVHLNDSCIGVFSFWRSILDETERFCEKVWKTNVTVSEWRKQKEIYARPDSHDRFDIGFSMFFLNRCNRSGIMNGGVIGGLEQNGPWKIDARFPKQQLVNRIRSIAKRKKDIRVRRQDAERFLQVYVAKLPKNTLVYCDPPYFKKADRLYPNYYKAEHHKKLSKVIQSSVKHPWLVSYDSCPQIHDHYRKRSSFEYALQYNAARAYKGSEIFIFSDKLSIPSSSSIPSIDLAIQEMA